MQILSSGSFINLENREKIEQLIFTARELANAASQAEGFVNAGPSNGRLGVEMWQGAEYMCRDHEEATIKNIFLSNFLERLRDSGRVTIARPPAAEIARTEMASSPPVVSHIPPANIPIQNPPMLPAVETIPATETLEKMASIPESAVATDEYLGIISSQESGDHAVIETRSYADECVPESELEIVEQAEEFLAAADDIPEVGSVESLTGEQTPSVTLDTSSLASASPIGSAQTGTIPLVVANRPISAIVVPAKEPYQLENCTIKAVIQILAEERGIRKCVISLVTHDFFPEIAVAELDAADFVNGLPSVIAPVFERYKADFPVKVADKLKKEKSVSKKSSTKAVDRSKAKTGSTTVDDSKTQLATETVTTQTAASPIDQQASLFSS